MTFLNKHLLTLLLIIPIIGACSKNSQNQEMQDLVNSKEHDSQLFGWWQRADENTQYIFFDDSLFKMELYSTESGLLTQYSKETYWYTENGVLYSFKKATELTGIIRSEEKYELSDDGDSLTLKESDTGYVPTYNRVSHP